MTPPARSLLRSFLALAAAVAAGHAQALAGEAAPACSARSGPHIAAVVELYTSEGCNSCPPADRWLSGLKAQPGVVALAFHVDYWDRLGWKDRFASPEHTRRQAVQQAVNGARFSYTPQVVIDGRDRQDWPRARIDANRPAASVGIAMSRSAEGVSAVVTTTKPVRLAAHWSVTESGHRTDVRAGENHGVTLLHDFVVRELREVPAWAAAPGEPHTLRYTLPTPADAKHPRRINLVVVDADSGRPVQALALDC